MHPIERLRYLARAEDESAAAIAAEAAWTLAELAQYERPAVLTASRRLVERHPACGPLWWVAAKLLTSDDLYETAYRMAGELSSDPVGGVLAGLLRSEFTSSDVLAVTSPSDIVRDALIRRSSYAVRCLAGYHDLRHEVHQLGSIVSDVTAYAPEEFDGALEGASVLLLEPLAAGPAGLLVSAETATAVKAAGEASVPIWAVLGIGRLLNIQLAEASAQLAGARYEVVEAPQVELAVDSSGRRGVAAALADTTCPACPELLPRG